MLKWKKANMSISFGNNSPRRWLETSGRLSHHGMMSDSQGNTNIITMTNFNPLKGMISIPDWPIPGLE